MNILVKKVFIKICAIIVIMALTISDFLLVGNGIVSYAIDIVKTNSSNIEFTAYFMDENGEKYDAIERDINKEEYLYIDLAVKNEGYFNGNILLNNSNFKISEEILSPAISAISGNQVTLNQINAGSTETIKLKIEAVKDETIAEEMLNTKTEVMLQGQYVNSKNVEKDKYVDIKGTSKVEVKWKSSEEAIAELNAELLTNSIYNVNGEEKRVVQILVNSNVTNNNYPAKNTEINLNVLENVQEVRVHARSTAGTNKNIEFGSDNYVYNKANKTLKIKLSNEDKKAINWSKNASDEIVVTYILDKDESIANKEVVVNSKINTYDNKELSNSANVHIDKEKDGIVSYSLANNEDSIYKGKIYTGEEREYTEKNKINVDFLDTANTISLKANKATYLAGDNEVEANIIYKETKINKDEFIKIFGEEGYITIKDEAGNVIANITKEAQADENGNIIIVENTSKIEIITSKPIKIGTLNIENKKAILNSGYTREQINILTNIKETISGSYDSKENNTKESRIELKNTSSEADLKVNVTKLSSIEQNKNVKITVALKNNDESKDLYQNPTVKVILPKEVKKVTSKCKLLYENGLELNGAKISKENENYVMNVALKGTQTKYNAEAIEGTTLIIYADMELDELALDGEENITLNYTNEIATSIENNGEVQVPITIDGIDEETLKQKEEEERNLAEQNQTAEQGQTEVTGEAKIETTVKAYVGGVQIPEGETIHSGEVVTYAVTVANKGGATANRVDIIGNIPENTKYVKYTKKAPEASEGPDGEEDAVEGEFDDKYTILEENSMQEVVENLPAGKQKTVSYEVMINDKVEGNAELVNNISVNYNGQQINTEIKHKIENADLKVRLTLINRSSMYLKSNTDYEYLMEISNLTNRELKNVQINAKGNFTVFEIEGFENFDSNNIKDENVENNSFIIKSIPANSTSKLGLYVYENLDERFEANLSVTANNKYRSNQVVEKFIDKSVSIEMTSSNEGNAIRPGEGVDYNIVLKNVGNEDINNLKIEQQLSSQLKVKNITIDGNNTEYSLEQGGTDIENACTIYINNAIQANKTLNIQVSTITNKELINADDVQLKSISKVYDNEKWIGTSSEVDHILLGDNQNNYNIQDPEIKADPEESKEPDEETDDNNDDNDNKDDENNTEENNVDNNEVSSGEKNEVNNEVDPGEKNEVNNEVEPGENNEVNPGKNNEVNPGENNEVNPGENNEGNNGENDERNPNENADNQGTNAISGTAWFDENGNGQRDSNEQTLGGIKVTLFDLKNNKKINSTETLDNGFYSLTKVSNGNYVVIFEYDTEKYILTTYKADGIQENRNSDVENVTMNIDGREQNVSSTDTLVINDGSLTNIDIGLAEAKVFDLELSKTISKVTVTNNAGTEATNYDNVKLAKVDIKAKELSGSTVIVEYKISVKNNGEIAGYARNIVDYKPTDLSFNSELNSNWYQSGEYLYSNSLSNTKIEPGETKELTLVLTKTMTETNTGLVNNTSEIAEDYNSLNVKDKDSTPGNKQKSEDDMSSSDLIISVKTGGAISFVAITLSLMAIITAGAYIIGRKILKKSIKF